MKSKRATKETGAHIYCVATAMRANTHEIRSLAPPGDSHLPGRSVSSLWLLRQVSPVSSRNLGKQARPDVEEAQFVAANFMAAELHGLSDVNTEMQDCARVTGVGKGTM